MGPASPKQFLFTTTLAHRRLLKSTYRYSEMRNGSSYSTCATFGYESTAFLPDGPIALLEAWLRSRHHVGIDASSILPMKGEFNHIKQGIMGNLA